jgi:transcription elongation factor/antiterminator RfaH
MNEMENWYALNSKPHQECRVAEYLRRRQLEVYLPLVRVNPVNPRAARVRPYFPGYLFARCDFSAVGLSTTRWTPGLRGVVQFGGLPGIVSDALIGELRRRLTEISAAGGLVFDQLHRGDAVRIISGPFAGYEAVFDMRLSGADRVRVLLEIMRQGQPVERLGQPVERLGQPAGRQSRARSELARIVPVELDAGSIQKLR